MTAKSQAAQGSRKDGLFVFGYPPLRIDLDQLGEFPHRILIHINAPRDRLRNSVGMWQLVARAPFGTDLELAVLDHDGAHALAFACQRILGGWMKSDTKMRIDVRPSHWRPWTEARENAGGRTGVNG